MSLVVKINVALREHICQKIGSEKVNPSLNTDYRTLISPQNLATDNLLGDEISKQLKTITEANKVGKTLDSHDDLSK